MTANHPEEESFKKRGYPAYSTGSLAYYRSWLLRAYGVPAQVGGRVRYTGGRGGTAQEGTILSYDGYLYVRLDGEDVVLPYHPTWALQYLDEQGEVVWPHP